MCPPAIAAAAAVVTAAGAVYGSLQARAQGNYAGRIAQRNAEIAGGQARDAKERGQIEARQLDRQYAQLAGQQRAAMAANGIDLSYGSAERVQQDTAMLRAEDRAALDRNIYNAMKGYDLSASNYRSEAQAARMQGKAKMIGSFLSAGGSLLEGASQFGKL